MRLVALDWVNLLLADVRGGLGAYVNVYLLTDAHWSQATIGAVLTVSGLTGIMLHPSVGAWIDNHPGPARRRCHYGGPRRRVRAGRCRDNGRSLPQGRTASTAWSQRYLR